MEPPTPPVKTIVRFLASATHPTDPDTVYGPGHMIQVTDQTLVNAYSLRGLIEIVPENYVSPHALQLLETKGGL